jgi:GNAT superfamily N-acetyltransferase
MLAQAPLRFERAVRGWALRRVVEPDLGWYRELYARVGGPYLWAWRLSVSDSALTDLLRDPLIETYVFRADDADEGLLELSFRTPGECEIVYFGVTEPFIGSGAARFMMNRALEIAWSRPIQRFWLHTCTLDHPRAVPFYLRSGFRPFKREIEIFNDPRTLGKLPREAAPDVPLFE